jgi:hypothetical protein
LATQLSVFHTCFKLQWRISEGSRVSRQRASDRLLLS